MTQCIGTIKADIAQSLGRRVELTCRNRRKESKRRGILEGAYHSVFTVILLIDGIPQRVSFTYCDVLTKAVSVKPLLS